MKKILLFISFIIPFFTFASPGVMYQIQGRISDQESKEPLAWVELLMMDKDDTVSSAITDFDGNYTLYFFRPGTYVIHIESLGFQSQNYKSMLFSKEFLDKPESRINFKLEPLASKNHARISDIVDTESIKSELQGLITDKKTGEAVPFANIILSQGGIQLAGGQSDFDGNYVLKPIPPGKYSIMVSTIGYTPQEFESITLRKQTTHFVDLKLSPIEQYLETQPVVISCGKKLIHLPPSSGIKGKILDKETREPIPFVSLYAEKNGVQISNCQSDFDGNYVFKELPPGKYTLKIVTIGYIRMSLIGIQLENEEIKVINLDLTSREMCITYCGGTRYQTEIEAEPIIDLITEQDSLNEAEDKLLPSSEFSTKAGITGFTAFPNPTSGELKMTNLSGIDKVNLIRIDGSIIKSIKTGLMVTKTMDISFLTPGVYFLQYIVEGKLQSHRVIKL